MDFSWPVSFLVLGILTIKFQNVLACDGYAKLSGTRGDLASPRYPKYNPKASHCHWLITVEQGYFITLEFEAFDVGQSTECSKRESRKTYLEVRDSANASLGSYCGSSRPNNVRSSGNQMWVEYVTNGYTSTKFVARYNTVKDSTVVTVVLFALAAIFGTIICVVVIIALIKRKCRNVDDDINSHVAQSRDVDSNNDNQRTCTLAHIPSLILLGNVNKGMDDYVMAETQIKYSCNDNRNHGNENHYHSNGTPVRYDDRNQQECRRCHDNIVHSNGNDDNKDMVIIDIESKYSSQHDRLSPHSDTKNRKPSDSESIVTTGKVIFVQDSSSSRSGSTSSNEQ